MKRFIDQTGIRERLRHWICQNLDLMIDIHLNISLSRFGYEFGQGTTAISTVIRSNMIRYYNSYSGGNRCHLKVPKVISVISTDSVSCITILVP